MTRDQKYKAFKALHARHGNLCNSQPMECRHRKDPRRPRVRSPRHHQCRLCLLRRPSDSAPELTRDHHSRQRTRNRGGNLTPRLGRPTERIRSHPPNSCSETIRLAAATGLVGASIEDATGDESNPIYELQAAKDRIVAASEAARRNQLLLTARAENFLHGKPDLDDTIRRLQAFDEAGADVLYAPGTPHT